MSKYKTHEANAMTSLVLETFRLNGALLLAGNRLTKPFELTSARWQVMGVIDMEGRALTVAQIARRMSLTRQAVQRVVNDLEKLRMVTFIPNIDHKRAPLVLISDTGNKVMLEIDKVQSAWVNDLSEGLSEKQIKQTLQVFEAVVERIK